MDIVAERPSCYEKSFSIVIVDCHRSVLPMTSVWLGPVSMAAPPVPANAAPPTATPTDIVAGTHAQPGPSGVPETVVAIHHPHTKHWLTAGEDGKVEAHHDFNHPKHRHHSGKHAGHWCAAHPGDILMLSLPCRHVEHHGKHHRIRSAHGHYLHVNPAASGSAAIHTTPHHLITDNANFKIIADAEARKHHLQGPSGNYLAVQGDPPEPVIASGSSHDTAVVITPPQVAAATPAGTAPAVNC
jgi:hypothetical protein